MEFTNNFIKSLDFSNLKIAVDFDGTLTKGNYYPEIKEPLLLGFKFLKQLQKQGAEIYLDTMRSGQELKDAINFCKKYGLVFNSIGPKDNQFKWTDSMKCHADYSIDDRNIGTPLLEDDNRRYYVDWEKLIKIFLKRLNIEGWIL